ncbi:unnamed protein product [Menidia menidia]|uniref:(Atlantic silverside) hypothetical protein n=1 Tax=Menidia menidia TaxID=238744 RepID=A0A8S4BJ79_9TELE|nr:unnamed protein product [Menidia menidia]
MSGSVHGPLSPPSCGPFVQVGTQGLEGWPMHFPPRMPNAGGAATATTTAAAPPTRDFQPVTPVRRLPGPGGALFHRGNEALLFSFLPLFHLGQHGFPWQMPFSQPRGARAVGESTRPPPENADLQLAVVAPPCSIPVMSQT